MDIVGHRRIFYTMSGALVLASVGALVLFGLRLGIDFTGGTLLEVTFEGDRPSLEAVTERLNAIGLTAPRIQPVGTTGLFIRLPHIDEATHERLIAALGDGVREKRFDAIGPTIGRELARKSILAIALVIVLIVSYIAYAFRKVSEPMASWTYGVVTVVALVHDVIIPAGFFAVAGHVAAFEVDTLFVTAILTILGFSVHDTIVVFDRIRENLKKKAGASAFAALVNRSVTETLVRSINTSLTVVLAIGAVYVLGGASTKAFTLTLMIGIVVGTYSSICIASPLLVTWQHLRERRSRHPHP